MGQCVISATHVIHQQMKLFFLLRDFLVQFLNGILPADVNVCRNELSSTVGTLAVCRPLLCCVFETLHISLKVCVDGAKN